MKNDVYQVHSMHGPTVYGSDHNGFEKLLEVAWRISINAGPYRVIYLPTGEEVARFDRDSTGAERRGSDTLWTALARRK